MEPQPVRSGKCKANGTKEEEIKGVAAVALLIQLKWFIGPMTLVWFYRSAWTLRSVIQNLLDCPKKKIQYLLSVDAN